MVLGFELIQQARDELEHGDLRQADILFRKAVRWYRKKSSETLDFVLGHYADFLVTHGRYDEANALTNEAIQHGTRRTTVWWSHYRILARKGDLVAMRDIPRQMIVAQGDDSIVGEIVTFSLQLASEGAISASEGLLQETRDACFAKGFKRGGWMAVHGLGIVSERYRSIGHAVAIWRSAIQAGSREPATFERLAMILERQKAFEEAISIVEAALMEPMPAVVEQRLRKRRVRCEAKFAGNKSDPSDVDAFSMRQGAQALVRVFQLRLPHLRVTEFQDDTAIVMAGTGSDSTISKVELRSGKLVWRRPAPSYRALRIAPDGAILATVRTTRIGDGPTHISFLSSQADIMAQQIVPDATTDIVFVSGIWFVGCRNGALYGFSAEGELQWTWWTPGSGNESTALSTEGAKLVFRKPCPYYLAKGKLSVALSSWSSLWGVNLQGKTLWHHDLPQSPRTFVNLPGGSAPSATAAFGALGLSVNAPPDEVKRAHRRLAMATHPDRNPNDSSAPAKFVAVQQAYEAIERGELNEESRLEFVISIGPPSVGSLHSATVGFIAVARVGHVSIHEDGELSSLQEFDGKHTKLFVDPTGQVAAIWWNGTISIRRGDHEITAVPAEEVPDGMFCSGQWLLHWLGSSLSVIDLHGRSVASIDFASRIRAATVRGDLVVVFSDVLAGFRLRERP